MSMLPEITLIKAGAGAGKTYTIQDTLTKWIKEGLVSADRVLAVTFTNAAASEMRQRIKLALLNSGQVEQAALLPQSMITTIHSFGLSLIEHFAFEKGLSPVPSQIDINEEEFLLAEVLSELEEVRQLLDDADKFGYRETQNGGGFQSKYQQLQKTILQVNTVLRSVGKDALNEKQVNVANAISSIIEQSEKKLDEVYGSLGDENSINEALRNAVSRARDVLPPQDDLNDDWGKGNNSFVNALFELDLNDITNDWSKWISLQELGAPTKVYGTKNKPTNHEHVAAVEAVLEAANGLHEHPQPLREAHEHIGLLLKAALSTSQRYQNKKREAGLVDYADMVSLAYSILQNDEWLTEFSAQFDCLIIDEFQDTNPLQFAVLHRLHEKGVPVFVVGDLKQAIMGFQGADSRLFARLLKFNAKNPGAVKELPNNWRSTAELMTFVNIMGEQLYGAEYTKLASKMTEKSDLQPVRVLKFDSDWIEKPNAKSNKPCYSHEGYQLLANEVVKLLNPENGVFYQVIDKQTGVKRNIRPADIAVLAKNNSTLSRFADVLRGRGVSAQIQQEGFLKCPVVMVLLDALQAINNTDDKFAWTSLVTSPLLSGDPVDELNGILNSALKNYQSGQKSARGDLKHPLKETLLLACKGVTQRSLSEQLHTIIEALDLFEVIKAFPDHAQFRTNTLKLIQLSKQFEQQSEITLRSLGIVGKHGSSFQTWLNKASSMVQLQPLANPVATDAVVLTTWHRSKGLEWPVVLVLQAEDAPKVRLPSIAVEYQGQDDEKVSDLLDSSTVQVLPEFADKKIRGQLELKLERETEQTAKNLYYVALTRAREQLIVPIFEKSFERKGTLSQHLFPVIESLTTDERSEILIVEDIKVLKGNVPTLMLEQFAPNVLIGGISRNINKPYVPTLLHTISPSQHSEIKVGNGEITSDMLQAEVQEYQYQPVFDLDRVGLTGAVNELGTWVHRVYQVYFVNPILLPKAYAMPPCPMTNVIDQRYLEEHILGFKKLLEDQCGALRNIYCEVAVTGLNIDDQVISGVIDMLVEDDNGKWWIIDHKTDRELLSKRYWEQLFSYQRVLSNKYDVAGLVLNWTRHGKISVLRL